MNQYLLQNSTLCWHGPTKYSFLATQIYLRHLPWEEMLIHDCKWSSKMSEIVMPMQRNRDVSSGLLFFSLLSLTRNESIFQRIANTASHLVSPALDLAIVLFPQPVELSVTIWFDITSSTPIGSHRRCIDNNTKACRHTLSHDQRVYLIIIHSCKIFWMSDWSTHKWWYKFSNWDILLCLWLTSPSHWTSTSKHLLASRFGARPHCIGSWLVGLGWVRGCEWGCLLLLCCFCVFQHEIQKKCWLLWSTSESTSTVNLRLAYDGSCACCDTKKMIWFACRTVKREPSFPPVLVFFRTLLTCPGDNSLFEHRFVLCSLSTWTNVGEIQTSSTISL